MDILLYHLRIHVWNKMFINWKCVRKANLIFDNFYLFLYYFLSLESETCIDPSAIADSSSLCLYARLILAFIYFSRNEYRVLCSNSIDISYINSPWILFIMKYQKYFVSSRQPEPALSTTFFKYYAARERRKGKNYGPGHIYVWC